MDELLEELQGRIAHMRGTRDRVHTLLEAVLAVGRGLELPQVLRRIVQAAVTLVDAEYGALGVIGGVQTLSAFITVGIDDELQDRIGEFPIGRGVLGELIRHPEPLRLAEISDHPASYGFPAHHPPMHSFLGVPIRVRDEVFGVLYLTEKRGAKEFDAEDESVLSTLAVAAGVGIENARLYEQARRREEWLAASGEVTNRLLLGVPRGEVLRLIVERARQIVSADLGVVAVSAVDGDRLRVACAVGQDAEAHEGLDLSGQEGLVGAAVTEGAPVFSDDIAHDPRGGGSPRKWVGLGPAVAVPMGAQGAVRGVLLFARRAGRSEFLATEAEPLLGFAGQAALAMELVDRRRDAEQVALLEDRDRIARDLHDLAIQRLFATGMALQSAERLAKEPRVAERLGHAVDELDDTIKIIRSAIFGLRSRDHTIGGSGLRMRVAKAVEEAGAALGFSPALRVEGLVDTEVPQEAADHAIAVLGEALSNVVRHARATGVEVHVVAEQGELSLTVIDDGRGIPAGARHSGLANMEERARQLGGVFSAERPAAGGTRLSWRVPLRRGSRS
ncbi:GAF domain-containing protein [Streptomyces sp. NPDC050085]|uniref:sensor histidine kinase n=1 Tax=Streptomyces sp. NPDC050085 TaxID=3365600 RepID=UPI003799696D